MPLCLNKKGLVFTEHIGSHFATQGVFVIAFTLSLFVLSDSGDKVNISTEVAIGKVAQGLAGEERKDVLGPLPTVHQYDQEVINIVIILFVFGY